MVKKLLIISFLFICVLLLLLSYSSPQTWGYKKPAYKGQPLPAMSSLDQSRFTSEKLKAFRTYLSEESSTTGMMVLENGHVVFEYGEIEEVSYIASCRKSVLAMLYGKYVENGIMDLDETIGQLGIDEDDGLLPIEKQAKLRFLTVVGRVLMGTFIISSLTFNFKYEFLRITQ